MPNTGTPPMCHTFHLFTHFFIYFFIHEKHILQNIMYICRAHQSIPRSYYTLNAACIVDWNQFDGFQNDVAFIKRRANSNQINFISVHVDLLPIRLQKKLRFFLKWFEIVDENIGNNSNTKFGNWYQLFLKYGFEKLNTMFSNNFDLKR